MKIKGYGLAFSKAGHDKGKIYVIKEELGEYVTLVDGITKTMKSPKRKNRKHIQPIHVDTDGILTDQTVQELLCRYYRENAKSNQE